MVNVLNRVRLNLDPALAAAAPVAEVLLPSVLGANAKVHMFWAGAPALAEYVTEGSGAKRVTRLLDSSANANHPVPVTGVTAPVLVFDDPPPGGQGGAVLRFTGSEVLDLKGLPNKTHSVLLAVKPDTAAMTTAGNNPALNRSMNGGSNIRLAQFIDETLRLYVGQTAAGENVSVTVPVVPLQWIWVLQVWDDVNKDVKLSVNGGAPVVVRDATGNVTIVNLAHYLGGTNLAGALRGDVGAMMTYDGDILAAANSDDLSLWSKVFSAWTGRANA